ncbi:MAG: CGNR zinc finger domain-containing protein [Specibacter sp.]
MTNVPLPPAPGTAEHICLALANSIVTLPGGLLVDELKSPEDATTWLIGHQLAPEGTGLLLYCQLQLAGLREHLREVLRAHIEGTVPAPEALEGLNHALTAVPSAALLHYSPEVGLRRGHGHPLTQIVDHAMAQIAEDAAGLLTGPEAPRIAICAAAPCDRFMVRTHARRQWCSERCGARQRANRSYARKLEKSAG